MRLDYFFALIQIKTATAQIKFERNLARRKSIR